MTHRGLFSRLFWGLWQQRRTNNKEPATTREEHTTNNTQTTTHSKQKKGEGRSTTRKGEAAPTQKDEGKQHPFLLSSQEATQGRLPPPQEEASDVYPPTETEERWETNTAQHCSDKCVARAPAPPPSEASWDLPKSQPHQWKRGREIKC